MSFPHGWFQLVGLKAATNSTSFSSRHGGWTSQNGDTSWCQELGTYILKSLALSNWRLLWSLYDLGAGDVGVMWVFLATALWPRWLVGRSAWGWLDATCNNHQLSATQNHNPCWYSWSDSDYQPFHHHVSHLNQLTMPEDTCGFASCSSSWIKMVLPPSWDHHFKMIIQGLLGCSLTRESGTILCKLCWSQDIPVASSCNESVSDPIFVDLHILVSKYPGDLRDHLSSGLGFSLFSLIWMAPIRRTKPCLGCWQWRYFLGRPTEPCTFSGHGGRIDVPLNINTCFCMVFEVSHVLTWVLFFNDPPCQCVSEVQ